MPFLEIKESQGNIKNNYPNKFENLGVMGQYFEKQISQN